jgi:hypothetical protein
MTTGCEMRGAINITMTMVIVGTVTTKIALVRLIVVVLKALISRDIKVEALLQVAVHDPGIKELISKYLRRS